MHRFVSAALIISALSACGGGSSGGGGSGSNGIPSELAGVYAWDETYDGDEGYTVIGSDGSLSFYDYAGDSYEDYANCYWIGENYGEVSHNSGNQYTTTYFVDNETEIVTIDVTSTGIVVAGEDEDGEWEEVLTRVNLNVSDFTPECGLASKPDSLPVRKTKF